MSSPVNQQLPILDAYIDESSHTQHRFLVLGGLILPKTNAEGITKGILRARLPDLQKNDIEMKWTKVSRTKLPAYIRAVDVFFHPKLQSAIHYHSLVVDTSKQNHARFNQGSREIGFNKELYQLCRKFGRLYPTLFHIYPDRRTTDQKPEDLRLILNRGIKKDGDKRDWPYRRLQFRDSDECHLLQLTDILTGAIAFRLNRHDKAQNASPAKIKLSSYILAKACISDVRQSTHVSGKFTIWHRQLR